MLDSWDSWTVACQASLSVGFTRQENWGGLPFPSPGDFPDPEVELRSPALQADSLTTELRGKKPYGICLSLWLISLSLIPCCSPTLLQMARFHPYICIVFFIHHSCIEGHLGCLYILTIVINAIAFLLKKLFINIYIGYPGSSLLCKDFL